MAQHGYLGDDYGSEYDPNWDDERDDRERARDGRSERERGAMFGGRDRFRDDDDDRSMRRQGWRSSDAGEWFGGRGEQRGGFGRERPFGSRMDPDRGMMFGESRSDWERAPRNFSSNRDDHYRSWRDKQMQALDRDYEDYCREREQQFHQDFDSWRQNRQQPRGHASSARFDPTGSSTNALNEPQVTVDPESAATLGTGTDTSAGRRKG